VSLVEQERLTLPEHLSSPPVFSRVRVSRSLVLYVCFVDHCLFFCTFSFGHCVVCSSSIYGFWLTPWYLPTLLTSLCSTAIHLYFKRRWNINHMSNIRRKIWNFWWWNSVKITLLEYTIAEHLKGFKNLLSWLSMSWPLLSSHVTFSYFKMSPVLSDHFFLSLKGDLWTMYFGSVDVYEDMPLISSVPHRDKILNCRSRRPDRQGSPPKNPLSHYF
jgi:hypothetical protein